MPIYTVPALYNYPGYTKIKARQAGNLEKSLPLCIGCLLIITENLWTKRGIVNSTQYRLYNIV